MGWPVPPYNKQNGAWLYDERRLWGAVCLFLSRFHFGLLDRGRWDGKSTGRGGLRLPNVLSPNAAGLARFFLDTPRCSAIN